MSRMRYLPPGVDMDVDTTLVLPASTSGGTSGGTEGGTTPATGGMTAAELEPLLTPLSNALSTLAANYSPLPQTAEARDDTITGSLSVETDRKYFTNNMTNYGILLIKSADPDDATSKPGKLIVMKTLSNYGRILNYGRVYIGPANA